MENLKDGMDSLWAAWTRLRRSVRWKKYVKGCIVALEVTRNPEEATWHPHLNVLMQGEFFPFAELNQAWIAATEGRGRTSFITAADAGTVRELIKYVTKIADLIGNAPALDEFLTAVSRRRLLRTYGTLYARVEDEENPGTCCPDCPPALKSSIVRLGRVSARYVRIDQKGVLRVSRDSYDVVRELREAVDFAPSRLRPKLDNFFPRLRKRWEKAGLSFEERSLEFSAGAKSRDALRADLDAAGLL